MDAHMRIILIHPFFSESFFSFLSFPVVLNLHLPLVLLLGSCGGRDTLLAGRLEQGRGQPLCGVKQQD